jgi:hypothetical protein
MEIVKRHYIDGIYSEYITNGEHRKIIHYHLIDNNPEYRFIKIVHSNTKGVGFHGITTIFNYE